jgi:MATE family multidrug resistance protein
MNHTRPTLRHDILPLIRLGMPLVGSSIAAFAIHMTDTIMLGWYDVTALAAVTLGSSWWFILYIFGAGFGFAVMPLVAAAAAKGDDTRARRVTRMAFWLSLAFFAAVLPLLWWSGTIFLWMGQQVVIAGEAQKYLRIAGFGIAPGLLVVVLRSYLSAQHMTAILLWVTLGGVVFNAGVNYILIFGNFGAPELGIRGAAMASVLIQTLTMLILAVYSNLKLPEIKLFQRIWKADGEALSQVFRMGVPIGLTSLAESGLFSASAVMMGWIGELELAAHGIALQLAALAFMFHVGMSQASTIRAGGDYGRNDAVGLRRTAWASLIVGLSFSVIVVSTFTTIPEVLVGLFVDPLEPQRVALITIAAKLLMFAALFQFVDAGQIIALSLLRGVQDTAVPMWLATISYWIIGLPAGYVLAFVVGLNEVGLWLGLCIGLGMAALTLMWRFWARSVKIG